MHPTAYYLYITEKHADDSKSMEKGHMMEIAKMKAHIREIATQLTDMWFEFDADSKN